jgi:hypothetical protein
MAHVCINTIFYIVHGLPWMCIGTVPWAYYKYAWEAMRVETAPMGCYALPMVFLRHALELSHGHIVEVYVASQGLQSHPLGPLLLPMVLYTCQSNAN